MHDFDMNRGKHFSIISEAILSKTPQHSHLHLAQVRVSEGWISEASLYPYFGYNDGMTFYTSKGDDGTTGLLGEGRVAKYHVRIEAVGTLDESTAALGLARAQCHDPHSSGILLEAQRDLYKLMAEVAATPDNAEKFHSIDEIGRAHV